MNKKVIIFMPSIEGGGVEKNLFIVSNYLVKKIDSVSIITISKKYQNKFDKKIEFISLKLEIWDKLPRRIKYFLALCLLFVKIIKNNDSIIFAFQANLYCIILCKILGNKIIVRSNSAPAGWSKNIFKKIIFKFLLNKADKIMANSKDFVQSLSSEFKVKATCIYNPLNKAEILKKSKIKIKKIFPKKKILKILSVGRFVDQKDQITLLKALNYLKNKINFKAVLVGRGEYESKLKNFINANNLKNKIKLLKFSQNPYPIIKQTDIFVLSSKYEGLPNVLLEAQVLKKFIISSDCPTGPREILMDGQGGLLFKVGDYKELANKIYFYTKNKKKNKQLVNFSFSKLDRFDYNKSLNKYLNLILKI